MKVIITGGGGFLGQYLAKSIIQRGTIRSGENAQTKVSEIVIADVVEPKAFIFPLPADGSEISVTIQTGDVSSSDYCNSLVGVPSEKEKGLAIFHLGAVMSGTGEQNFDLAMNANLRGTMNMLESARQWQSLQPSGEKPTFVFASAGATIGAGHPADWVTKEDTISDGTRAAPHTTYGCTKACCELLLSDYSRRGFIDGRGVRLPSVIVRAGAPNAATTSCFSSVVREPLNGEAVVLPIGPNVLHAVTGTRAAVDGMLAVHNALPSKADALLGFDRTVFLPTRAVTLGQLVEAMEQIVTPETKSKMGKIVYEENEFLSSVVGGFPAKVDSKRALELGAPPTPSLEGLIREYCEDFPDAVKVELTPVASVKDEGLARIEGIDTVAVITGGGSGIGRAVAERLARGGWGGPTGKGTVQDKHHNAASLCKYGIVLAGRRQETLEDTKSICIAVAKDAGVILEVLVVPTDVTVNSDLDSLFGAVESRFGRVDLLFNNAGINIPPASVHDILADDFRKVIDTNLTACWHVAKSAMKIMGSQSPQGGRIINNGSVSSYVPRPGAAPYTVSKHGVLGLTKSIALDGRQINVACGQIDFGNVTSNLTAKMSTGMPQADGSTKPEPTFSAADAADTVHAMAALPLNANVLSMTVMATTMPYVGRG